MSKIPMAFKNFAHGGRHDVADAGELMPMETSTPADGSRLEWETIPAKLSGLPGQYSGLTRFRGSA